MTISVCVCVCVRAYVCTCKRDRFDDENGAHKATHMKKETFTSIGGGQRTEICSLSLFTLQAPCCFGCWTKRVTA